MSGHIGRCSSGRRGRRCRNGNLLRRWPTHPAGGPIRGAGQDLAGVSVSLVRFLGCRSLARPASWSDTENAAIVAAYFWMLEEQRRGRPFVKANVRRELQQGELSARSNASIEFKFRNISAVLQAHDLDWIDGYLPALNYQADL